MENTAILSFLVTIFSILIGILINRFFIEKNTINKIRNKNTELRWSKSPKSTLGGVSFYLVFAITCLIISALQLSNFPFILASACTIGFIFGFMDDYFDTNSLVKFIGQVITALCFVYGNFTIQISDNLVLNNCFTALWIVGMMNSIHIIQHIDRVHHANYPKYCKTVI